MTPQTVQLSSLARKAMRGGGTIETQVQSMLDQINGDPELLIAVQNEAFRVACRAMLHQIRHTTFVELRQAAPKPSTVNARTGRFRMAVDQQTFLDWMMRNGKRLGDCTGDDLSSEIEWLKSLEAGYSRRRSFLEDIRSRCGRRIVRKVLTDEEIRAIYQSTRAKPKVKP